jgi:hypothetical protein
MDNNSNMKNDVKDDESGYIYIIKPQLLNGIKIGKSTQTINQLYNRYVTAYGGNMVINYYKTSNRHYHEKKIHYMLKDYHTIGEIFQTICYENAKNTCLAICNDTSFEKVYTNPGRQLKDPDVEIVCKKIMMKVEPENCEGFYDYLYTDIINSDPHIVKTTLSNIYGVYVISNEFLLAYYNKYAINIYKNLQIIFGEKQLDTKNKIACELMRLCGYKNILDTHDVKSEDILKNFKSNEDYIKEHMKLVCCMFDGKRALMNYSRMKSILEFVNGIIYVMYGIRIGLKSTKKKDKGTYSIKHSYIGIKFALGISDKMPYIIPKNNCLIY